MLPDSTIGPYRIVRALGQGGMGDVSLAYDDRLKRHVALKTVRAERDDPDARSALVREARAAAGLSHPGIASIFDIVEQADRAYIVMEYVEGVTLAARLKDGPLPHRDAMTIALQLCDALARAHDSHIIHRDLKPGNIMIAPDHRAKILDFGLAKRIRVVDGSAPTEAPSTTLAGEFAGTIGYIAPEQITGRAIDRRADLYSFGAVLFEMFTGRRPFLERDAVAYAVAVTTTAAPAANAVNAGVGAALSAVIAKALARHPEDRFTTASELAQAIRDAETGTSAAAPLPETVDARAPSIVRRPNQRVAIASGAGLAAAVAGALMLIAWPTRPATPTPVDRPAVLAVVPATALDVDDTTQAIAAGVTGTVTSNLAAVSAINVVPGVAAAPSVGGAPNVEAIMQRVGATWALSMTVGQQPAGLRLRASLRKAGEDQPAWDADLTGTAAAVTQRLLGELATALADADIVPDIVSSERRRLLAAPTTDNAAFVDYSRGRRRLSGVVNAEVFEAASQDFQKAIDRDPNFALAYAGLAEARWRAYTQVKNPVTIDQAIEAAHKAIALDPMQAAAQLSLANVLNLTGRSTEALAAVDRAIELQPASDDAYRLRGRLLLQAGRMDDGFASLHRALSLRPAYWSNHEMLGFWLYRGGRFAEAADSYRRVTELAPDFANGYRMLGTTLHQLGRVEEAVGHYEHSVRLGPTAPAYSNLAYSYYETGRFEDALAAYREALKRDDRVPATHRNIGDVLMKLGRRPEARKAYETAIATGEALLKVNRTDARTISIVALSEAKLGRTLAAERHAAEALVLAPKELEVAVRNAEVYAILRQPSRAFRALRTALALGYDPAIARKNEELQSIHATPGFAELLAASKK